MHSINAEYVSMPRYIPNDARMISVRAQDFCMPHFHDLCEAMASSEAPAARQQSLAACLGMKVGQNLVKVEGADVEGMVSQTVANLGKTPKTATKSPGAHPPVKANGKPKGKAKAEHNALQDAETALTEAAPSAIVGPAAGSVEESTVAGLGVAAVETVSANADHTNQGQQAVAVDPSIAPNHPSYPQTRMTTTSSNIGSARSPPKSRTITRLCWMTRSRTTTRSKR